MTGHQHLFIDGSCFSRPVAFCASASWAVVNAASGFVTGHGHLPGVWQSSSRAELFAICAALQWIIHFQVAATIWFDSQFVVKGVQNIPSGKWIAVTTSVANHDLWERIFDLFEQIDKTQLFVNWIPSHLEGASRDPGFEEWASCWNDVTDTCAVATNEHRDQAFDDTLKQATAYHELWAGRIRVLRAFYTHVAKAALDEPQVIDLSHEIPSDELALAVGETCLSEALPINWKDQLSECLTHSESHTFFAVQMIDQFFFLEHHASEYFQISFVELTLWLVQDRGLPVLVDDGVGGKALRSYDGLLLKPTVASLAQIVRQTMKKILVHLGLAVFAQHAIARLESGIQLSTDGLIVHSHHDLISRVSELSRNFAGKRLLRKAADLARQL